MLTKIKIALLALCFNSFSGFGMEEITLTFDDGKDTKGPNVSQISEITPLTIDYSQNTKQRTWKYGFGQVCTSSYACCYSPSEGCAYTSVSPGCFTAFPTLALPGLLTICKVKVPAAVFTGGIVASSICGAAIPTWLCGSCIVMNCAECLNNKGWNCSEFLEPKHQWEYEGSVHQDLKYLKKEIKRWNAHMTSPEKNETTVINLFEAYIKKKFNVDLKLFTTKNYDEKRGSKLKWGLEVWLQQESNGYDQFVDFIKLSKRDITEVQPTELMKAVEEKNKGLKNFSYDSIKNVLKNFEKETEISVKYLLDWYEDHEKTMKPLENILNKLFGSKVSASQRVSDILDGFYEDESTGAVHPKNFTFSTYFQLNFL